MKKVYEKPQIVFESFTMTTNIAGDCEPQYVGNPSRGECGIPSSKPNEYLFASAENGCNRIYTLEGGDMYNGFCYHVPTEDKNFFNS